MTSLLTEAEINRNIQWLCENGSAPVRYLTHKYLLHTPAHSKQMIKLWLDVVDCPEAKEIFSKQRPDGSWYSGGGWAQNPSYTPKGGYSAFTPKYVTAVWVLSVLGDMGFTIRDPKVAKAHDYVMSYQWSNGLFSRFKVPHSIQKDQQTNDPDNAPCNLSVFLLVLSKVSEGRITNTRSP